MSDIPSSPAPGHGRAGGDEQPEQPNATMLRQARGWFIKSLEIAPDEVATEFIRLVRLAFDAPYRSSLMT